MKEKVQELLLMMYHFGMRDKKNDSILIYLKNNNYYDDFKIH